MHVQCSLPTSNIEVLLKMQDILGRARAVVYRMQAARLDLTTNRNSWS